MPPTGYTGSSVSLCFRVLGITRKLFKDFIYWEREREHELGEGWKERERDSQAESMLSTMWGLIPWPGERDLRQNQESDSLAHWATQVPWFLNLFFVKILFIYSWDTHTERQRDRQREKQAPSLMWDLIPGLQDHNQDPQRQMLNHWVTQVPGALIFKSNLKQMYGLSFYSNNKQKAPPAPHIHVYMYKYVYSHIYMQIRICM